MVAGFASIVFLVTERVIGKAKLATLLGLAAGFIFRAAALRFQWRTKAAR